MKKKKLLSVLVAAAVVTSGTTALPQFSMTGRAEETETVKTITGLGTGAITNPVQPESSDDDWSGSFVYYGKWASEKYGLVDPVRYRVLDKASEKYGVKGGSLFLDCDSVLYNAQYDEDRNVNAWEYSDVKTCLNGESFLDKEGSFTEIEKSSIAGSTAEMHWLKEGTGAGEVSEWTNYFVTYTPLTGEKVFLLDVEDVQNIVYGYRQDHCNQRVKKTFDWPRDNSVWWLRSPSNYYYQGSCAGYIGSDGALDVVGWVHNDRGVSPAFNIGLSSVIFSSLVPSEDSIEAGQPGAEYKLTLCDKDLSISVVSAFGTGTRDDSNKVTIPYSIKDNSSADPTQVSVVVTNGTWTENGWSKDAELLQYEKLDIPSFMASGVGSFTMDSSIKGTWGKDYHVYILAEDVNGEKETDYASEPVEVKAVTVSASNYEGFYDGKAHGIDVKAVYPKDATVKYGKSANGCTLDVSPTFTDITESPETVYYQVMADGYLSATGSATVTIKKPAPTFTAPTARTLTYDGSAQELVDAGKVKNGIMQYALGTKEWAVQDFTTSIPTATYPGTYYVWYKVIGDEKYSDIEPECVAVKMNGAVETSEMHRLYNPNSGEHFYTKDAFERDNLISLGWRYEGSAWVALGFSSTPVYRVYNPNSGEHHYTMDVSEKDGLVKAGWNDEGIGWYSDDSMGVPLYRLYNPNATGQYEAGAHHYTKNVNEKDSLIAAGWRDEGIGWYGMDPSAA